jgi:hypothetical protein
MKILVLGLCSVVIPAFATNSSCPPVTSIQVSAAVGCQALDSGFANIASSPSPAAPQLDETSFASSLFPAVSMNSLVTVTSPTIGIESSDLVANTGTLSALAFEATPPSAITQQNTFSIASAFPEVEVSLSGFVLPSAFLQNPASQDFLEDSFGSDLPEADSIGLIGSGLVCLSLVANVTRKRKKRNTGSSCESI